MTSITEKIAAAKAAPRQTLDVTIALDKDLAKRREELVAEVAAAKAKNDDRLSAPTEADAVQEKLDEILAQEADSLVQFRFTKLPGDAWADITRLCPPNPDSIFDVHYNFDLNEVCKIAAQYVDSSGRHYGHVVEGDELTTLTANPVTKADPTPLNEWEDIFAEMSGAEFAAVVDTIYSLNVYGPTARLNALVKISASLTA